VAGLCDGGKTRSCNPAVAPRSYEDRGLVSIVMAYNSGEHRGGGTVMRFVIEGIVVKCLLVL